MNIRHCACVLQNEVAYEYFTDRFTVTAQRPYKKASPPEHTHWTYALCLFACHDCCHGAFCKEHTWTGSEPQKVTRLGMYAHAMLLCCRKLFSNPFIATSTANCRRLLLQRDLHAEVPNMLVCLLTVQCGPCPIQCPNTRHCEPPYLTGQPRMPLQNCVKFVSYILYQAANTS